MRKLFFTTIATGAVLLSSPATVAAKDNSPVKPAEYVEISAIHIKDGYGRKYMDHLAEVWRKGMDYRVEKGWIESYEILRNIHPREGEPNIYLVTRYTEVASSEEGRKRGEEMRAQMATTVEEMQRASAGRAEYRTLGGTMVLRRLVWND
jgi:hypothetical protein